jgi:hypothetical protein
MKRNYNGTTSATAKYFIGVEVENTPAKGMPTFFVTGVPPLNTILEAVDDLNINHVYLGANHTFKSRDSVLHSDGSYNHDLIDALSDLIDGLLEKNLWVTLDYDMSLHEVFLELGCTEHPMFIPMVSVKLPYLDQLGYNACIKIDDKDFNATNYGVWVHRVRELMDVDKFTPWAKYNSDTIVNNIGNDK